MKIAIINYFDDKNLAGFKLLAFAISQIGGTSIEDARATINIDKFCRDYGTSVDVFEGYFDRLLSGDNVFNWYLQYTMEGRKGEAHQIVTDVRYDNGNVEFYFNAQILTDLREFAKFYEAQMESIKACECSFEQYLECGNN